MSWRSNTYYLKLTDAAGRTVDEQLFLFQEDQLVWDLTYNGILHSIANGAYLLGRAENYFPSRQQLTGQPDTPHTPTTDTTNPNPPKTPTEPKAVSNSKTHPHPTTTKP